MKNNLILALVSCVIAVVLCDKEHSEHGHHHPDDIDGQHNTDFDHEAILGKDGVKEFADLSPEASKEHLRRLAIKMDTSGDGIVNREELQAWILKSFIKMDVDDANQRLAEYDTDKNGQLSWPEIMQNVYSYSEEDLKELKSEHDDEGHEIMDMIDDDQRKFHLSDRDGDQQLTKEEFAMFEHPYNYDHMQDVEIDRMLKEHDKNKDGKITYEEFIALSGDPENEEYDKEQFSSLDKDQNLHLDRQEVGKWTSPDNEESAGEEADHLIQHADHDQDGQLTIDEIVENYELFAGSQATDYTNYYHKNTDDL